MPELPQLLDKLLNRHFTPQTPGAMVLLAKGDEIMYLKAAGSANLQTAAPITPDTTFRLASVSKQFTAACVQLLAQRKALQLSDPLGLYFPELAHFKGVQLMHLLNHTSGLPDFEEHIPAAQTAQLTDEDVLHITAAQNTPLFSPGSAYRYSNTAYVLLGLLVERVSGINYADFLQENIFNPLQMQNSILYSPDALIPNRALGYSNTANGDFILSDQNIGTATRGDGCIYTSATDFLKWQQALLENDVFNIKNTLETNTATIDAEKGWQYGMGLFMAASGRETTELLHSGDTSGFTNLVIRLPRQKTSIICLSNIANNHTFLEELQQELEQFPDFYPASGLVKHLQELTR